MSADPKVITPEGFTREQDRPAALVPLQSTDPMQMLAVAVQRGYDTATLKDLMDLQQRFEKAEAEKAYNVAFAAFKAKAVSIIKNKTVTAGPLQGKSYAELFAVVDAATPALSEHGLSASWKITKDDKDWIEVTCTLKHVKGHAESVSLGGPPDVGGAKNPIQARASTVTYLERYTFKAVTGLAEKSDDSDGNAAGGVTMDELQKLVKTIKDATTEEKAKAAWQKACVVAEEHNDLAAHQALKDALREQLAFIKDANK